ncbi:hypothetical protein GE21DRAFT_1205826, partial [Neurospora crassa]
GSEKTGDDPDDDSDAPLYNTHPAQHAPTASSPSTRLQVKPSSMSSSHKEPPKNPDKDISQRLKLPTSRLLDIRHVAYPYSGLLDPVPLWMGASAVTIRSQQAFP